MKVLIVMGRYFPGMKAGGPPVSVDNFCTLMKDYDCYIVTHNHDADDPTPYNSISKGWNDRGNCKVLYVSDSEYNASTFKLVIDQTDPDILYLQGLFQSCVFPCLKLAKQRGINVLLAPRGELCSGALNIKKWKKIPYIKVVKALGLVKSIHWQSTSDEETAALKILMNVSDDHIHRLDNIPSIPKAEYPRREKIAGEGRFVFLSRIHPKKNLLFALSIFKDIEGKVEFDIYGPIEDDIYWKQCQDVIKKLPNNVQVSYKGLRGHDQVHEIFSDYDAFLFPTLSENYGHVIAESLMVGTPVIISDQTPWRGLKEAKAGWDLSLDDEEGFKNAVQKVVDFNNIQSTEQSIAALQFSANKMKTRELQESYHSAFMRVITKESLS